MPERARPRTILHVRARNGHHEVTFMVNRRERILIAAGVMLVVIDGGSGTVERFVALVEALAGWL